MLFLARNHTYVTRVSRPARFLTGFSLATYRPLSDDVLARLARIGR